MNVVIGVLNRKLLVDTAVENVGFLNAFVGFAINVKVAGERVDHKVRAQLGELILVAFQLRIGQFEKVENPVFLFRHLKRRRIPSLGREHFDRCNDDGFGTE